VQYGLPATLLPKSSLRAIVVAPIAAATTSACGQEDLGGAPNVKGLTLDVAQLQVKDAGFSVSAKDDRLFGVIIASHYTVCTQHTLNGKLVAPRRLQALLTVSVDSRNTRGACDAH
jgi:hypothetical protein